MIELEHITFGLLIIEIFINVFAYWYIPRRTKQKVLSYVKEIDSGTVKELVSQAMEHVDLEEMRKEVTAWIIKSMAGQKSGISRAGKGLDKMIAKGIVNHPIYGPILSAFGIDDYITKHPNAIHSLLTKWLPLVQQMQMQNKGNNNIPQQPLQ